MRRSRVRLLSSAPIESSAYANPSGLAFCFSGMCKHFVNFFGKCPAITTKVFTTASASSCFNVFLVVGNNHGANVYCWESCQVLCNNILLNITIRELLMKIAATVASLAFALAGCAASSDKIAATYVSPIQYQHYDCDQLVSEQARVQAAAIASGAQVDKAASNDAGITAAGAILFWPALFFLGGNQVKEAEYARLKGESEAIDKSVIEKKCVITPIGTPTLEAQIQPSDAVQTVEHITITSSKSPSAKDAAK